MFITPEAPSIFVAFSAGLITFFSPCIFPLIPGYLSFMSGETIENLKTGETDSKLSPRLKAFLGALFFGLGFTIVFVALGASATSIGSFFKEYQRILAQIGGVVVIIFGLHMIGVFKIKFLMKTARINYTKKSVPFYVNAFILGFVFVLGWTPCIGPILASILTVASQESSVTQGMGLLLVYSLGLWIPFLISALAINEVMAAVKKAGKAVMWVERIAGILLILIGILLVTNSMETLTIYLTKLLPFLPAGG